jgi:ribosomal protein S14
MAIKFQKKSKDKKNRSSFLKNEKKKLYLKFMIFRYKRLMLIKNKEQRTKVRLLLNNIMQKMHSFGKTKINNYCILTGRDKGVYRDFRLSRHQIRGNFKFLTGLKNSSF